ncbi:MAG: class I SAM-dependent methyltransferase [Acidibacillus sp.]|nr:class I SAM-dependent methyltransferase [Acidibacillus sp.]
MGHRFNPAHLERLLSPERQKMLPTEQILDRIGHTQETSFADVGVGPGYFALPAAKRSQATVYGVDVQPEMLIALKERAAQLELHNVKTVLGSADEIPLDAGLVDCTLCALVLHEVERLPDALAELKRITKAGGKIGIIEWEKKPTSYGPPVSERLAKEDLLEQLQTLHAVHIDEWEPNEDQYMLIVQL